MHKKTILILHPSIDIVGPRSIRTIHIAKHLANDFQIKILSFKTNSNEVTIPNVEIIRLSPSFFIRLFYQFSSLTKKKIRSTNGIKTIFKKRAKKVFFPDPWVAEHNKVLSFFKKEKTPNFDTIIASIGPYSNARLGMLIKRRFFNNAKLILDIGDPLVNNIENKKKDKKYISYEQNALQTADHIIVTNELTKVDYGKRYGMQKDKISIIGQGVSAQFINDIVSYKKERSAQIKIFYAGAFYKFYREPDNFIKAIKLINDKKIIVDIFDSLNYLSKEIAEINIHQKSPQIELLPFYQEADVLLFFDNAKGIQTPGKIYELLAMQKPILFIFSNKMSYLKIELENNPRIVFCKNEADEIKNGIEQIISQKMAQSDLSEIHYWKEKAKEFKKIITK